MVNDIQILKSDIVKMLKSTTNIDTLKSVHRELESAKVDESDMSFMEAVRPIRESVSLEEIMTEQNYKPVSYEEFRAKADEIEWEESLEELLEAIK